MMNSSRKKLCLLFFLFFLSSAFVFNNKTKIFISNREYNDTLVFKNVLSSISNHSKNRDAQGRLAYFKGYVLIPTGRDSGKEGGGFNFFDLSNPEKPILVKSIYTEETNLMREPHQFSISKRNGRDYIAVQSIRGILVFDFTDTFNPILVAEMTLPDIVPESDYSAAVWGVFWSGDHIYACGRENGLYVINVSDIGKPVLVKQFYLSELANTNANSIYILGNTMYLTSDSKLTVGTLTTPTTLSLNSTIDYPSENYSANYANGRVFSLGKNGKIAVVNVSDPYNLKLEGETDKLGSRGGYASYQSGYLFAGMSSSVTKVNIKDLSDYKVYEPNIKYTDWDFLNPIGNLIHLGNDHNHGGSLLMHHDGKRDKTGPWVDVFYPENKSIVNRNIVLGFAFSELLDYESVHAKNIIIKEKFTEKIVKGMFSCQQGIVNFTPSSPLKSNTTYQVSVKNNTIKDMLGNTNERSYQYSFTTNEKLVQEPCKIVVDNFRVKKGKKIFLSVFDESKGAKWEWSFGDQTNGIGRYVKHAFDKAGHYNVVVKQKGSDCSCNQLVTVYESLQERKPIESKKIITFKDENNTRFNGHFFNKYKEHFVTVLPDHNKVEYFVVKRGEVFRSATRSKSYSGKKPTSLTQVNGLDPEKRYIWVVNEGDATITEFYFEKTPTKKRGEIIEKLKKSRSISLPKFSKPLAIVPSYSGKKVYVSLNAIGKIAVIDVDAGKVENLVSIGGSPGELALAVDDKTLYVAHLFQQNGKGIISKVNVLSLKEEDQLIIQKDPGPDLDEGGRGVANILTDVVISPSGSKLLVSSKKDNIERGTLRDGNPLNFKNTVRSIVSEIDIKSGQKTDQLENRIDLDNRDIPTSISYTTYGDYKIITTLGSKTVDVYDAYTNTRVFTLEKVGNYPIDVVMGDRNDLYVYNYLSRNIVNYDLNPVVNNETGLIKPLATFKLSKNKEPLPRQILAGKVLFHTSNDDRINKHSYMSCASCHFDGGQDGQTWDFTSMGEGLRNTISLNGKRGTGHGALHWTANFDEIHDFENQIRELNKGTGFMKDEDFKRTEDPLGKSKKGLSKDLDNLSAYLESLSSFGISPFRNQDSSLTKSAVRGKKVFAKNNCYECHSGNDFTDSKLGLVHDVGTIKPSTGKKLGKENVKGIDTPTLLGLWETPPYFHDGSASSLKEAMVMHKGIPEIKSKDIDDLIEYLKQIDNLER